MEGTRMDADTVVGLPSAASAKTGRDGWQPGRHEFQTSELTPATAHDLKAESFVET
jgi:hypothetical protein